MCTLFHSLYPRGCTNDVVIYYYVPRKSTSFTQACATAAVGAAAGVGAVAIGAEQAAGGGSWANRIHTV